MQRTLDGGLILRTISEGHASDRKNLAAFYGAVFGEEGEEDAHEIPAWVEDLLSDEHPTTTPDDFWLVVDPAHEDKIVSAILLIPQTWSYAGVEFGVGRVELVATDKDYRRRGLVREQFKEAHKRSAELGHLAQAITGIPHYYRQFGYTMALPLGGGGLIPLDNVPKLKDDEQSKYTLRAATEADIPQMMAWDVEQARHFQVTTVHTAETWRFEMQHRTEATPLYSYTQIIVDDAGGSVGYIMLRMAVTGYVAIWNYVLGPDASYLATFDDVLRCVKALAEVHYKDAEPDNSPKYIGFDAGIPSAMHGLIRGTRGTSWDRTYAWYMRVPDMAAFLKAVKPVLEQRLNDDPATRGYTGELRITFYDLNGVTLKFEQGKLVEITGGHVEKPNAAFGFNSFLNVVFGHQSFQEMRDFYPDCYAWRDAAVVLDVLFPRQPSWVTGLA